MNTTTTPRTCAAIRDEAPALHYALLDQSHAYAKAVAEQNHVRADELMRVHRQTISGGWERFKVAAQPTTPTTQAAHTPGPWTRSGVCVSASTERRSFGGPLRDYLRPVATCDCSNKTDEEHNTHPTFNERLPGWAEAEANARLIAAAPELLAIVRALVAGGGIMEPSELFNQARAAILKAEGAK
jgi:hypothetical protein